MMRSKTGVFLVWLVAGAALTGERGAAIGAPTKKAAAAAVAEVARPRFVIKTERGFIDDPFAIDPDGGNLAVLLTDAASFARIDLIDLATGKPRKTVDLAAPERSFERVVLAPGGKGVVLISQDTVSTKRTAQYFDVSGTPAGALGPFDDFGTATRGGEKLLLAWQKSRGGAGEVTCAVAPHHLAGLAPAGKPVAYTVGKGNALQQPALEDVEWQDGYGQLVGLRAPEAAVKAEPQAVVLDTLTGAVVWQAEANDRVAWKAVRELRRKTPGRSSFLVFSPDTRALELFDLLGRHEPVALAAPVAHYDATTLVEQQDFATGATLFSLVLDRPGAAGAPSAKSRLVDFYRAEAQSARPATAREPLALTVEHLMRAPMDQRPVSWTVVGRHLAVLRKTKDFSRGGAQLELYTF